MKDILKKDATFWIWIVEAGETVPCKWWKFKNKIVTRKNVSSVVWGGEGFFNLDLYGNGVVAL